MKHLLSLTNGTQTVTEYQASSIGIGMIPRPIPANHKFPAFKDSPEYLQPDGRSRILDLFGVKIRDTTKQTVIEVITDRIKRQHKSRIAFVNADCVNRYYTDDDYKKVLNEYELVLADGVGVRLAAKLQGISLMDNLNGTDLFPGLLKQLAEHGRSVFFFGSAPGVASKMCERLKEQFPGLRIAGHRHGYDYNLNESKIIEQINQSAADVVFVALGAPRQEKWINSHHEKLNACILIGVGGLFDFFSGNVRRAPLWVRRASLEWVWRLMMQPKDKAKRYLLGNPLFLCRVARRYLITTTLSRCRLTFNRSIQTVMESVHMIKIALGKAPQRVKT